MTNVLQQDPTPQPQISTFYLFAFSDSCVSEHDGWSVCFKAFSTFFLH